MTTRSAEHCAPAGRLAKGLGWFSIGLGLAEVIAPGPLSRLIGLRSKPKPLLRLYGLRELAAGIGILTHRHPAGWMWARVGGDAVDLGTLISAMGDRRNDKERLALAVASVSGVTAADVYCAQQISAGADRARARRRSTRVVRTIIIDRSIEEIYNFWRNFENLPRFMDYLESVQYTGDRRTHWIANGPAGASVEWDADTVIDEANRMIAWRTVEDSWFQHSGSVRFERAPGDRGTLVRVEVDFSSNRGAATLGKLVKMDLGRRIMHDLRNLKRLLEVGEVIRSDASTQPGMHAAQPEPVYQH